MVLNPSNSNNSELALNGLTKHPSTDTKQELHKLHTYSCKTFKLVSFHVPPDTS